VIWAFAYPAKYPPETFAFYRLPRQHDKHLKLVNMLERLDEEIRPLLRELGVAVVTAAETRSEGHSGGSVGSAGLGSDLSGAGPWVRKNPYFAACAQPARLRRSRVFR